MTVDLLDLIQWFIVALTPAILAIWLYYTKVYEPNRIKEKENAISHNFKSADSTQEFTENQANQALESQLGIVRQLVSHIIESNNGHMTELTKSVIEGMARITEAVLLGDKEHTIQLEKMTAAYNQALVTLSRAAAFPSIQRHTDLDDILSARVKTEAVEATDAMAKAAGESVPGESTIEVTGRNI
jgi:LAS superfamily LD-carboxypeptidase LdcB